MNTRSEHIRGFTLIEVIVVIVVLGIVASVAIPKYRDVTQETKKSACRSSLTELRSAISIYYSDRAVTAGAPSWPEIDSLRTIGVVMQFLIPPNPFQPNAPDSIVTGVTPGVTVGTRGGWAYKPSTGQIWPNTNTSIPGGGCTPAEDIGESYW